MQPIPVWWRCDDRLFRLQEYVSAAVSARAMLPVQQVHSRLTCVEDMLVRKAATRGGTGPSSCSCVCA